MVMLLILGFVLGVLSILAVEGIVIVGLLRWLSKKTESAAVVAPQHQTHDPRQSLHSLYQKQGVIWVLEPEKVSKFPAPSQNTKKREVLEVSPVRKLAKVKDRTLILTEADGAPTKIMLKGCQVVAVSATSLPTRKWAKRYPIKVESKNSVLYQGSKVFYIYAETSWDKESWCKALRLASSDDKERLLWFSKLSDEFRCYLKSLTEGYPSLIKPSVGSHGFSVDKANRVEDPPSKVRQFWKKLSKKSSFASNDEKKIVDRSRVSQDSSVPATIKSSATGKMPNGSVEDGSSVSSASSTRLSEISEADAAEKFVFDEGTLCWNLLISRLFFDVKNNLDIKTALRSRIQRTLSNMRTPSYIGEVICTGIDPGNLPPYIHNMRAVPTDMNDLWALEMDIEYSGGMVLYIEARLEVELDSPNGMVDQNNESSSVGEAAADLLEDFKLLPDELRLTDGANDSIRRADSEDLKYDKPRISRAGVSNAASGSRWKSILNSVAKHVSQVPLTLAIRVATLKGTIQLHIKPPPSDQLWFGFTSMPDIQFQLESSVKDHKITSGRIASFLISRFKASIRETLVLPNCESACVSWMLAEKDDWIPQTSAPLLWLSREAPSETTTSNELSSSQSGKQKAGDRDLESKQGKLKKVDSLKQPIHEDKGQVVSSMTFSRSSSENSSTTSDDLRAPLLQNGEAQDCSSRRKEENSECHSPSRYISLREEKNNVEDDDAKAKRFGRKSRMFDLGKKMGEKFEEKRRHIEEKSRHIVDKMRGPGT